MILGYGVIIVLLSLLAWYAWSQQARAERAEFWIDEIIVELEKKTED